MIERVVSYRTGCGGEGRRCPGVSVELEKRREDSAQLASLADVVSISTTLLATKYFYKIVLIV